MPGDVPTWLRPIPPGEWARLDHVPPRDLDRARVVVVPTLIPGIAAITLDRVILVRRGHEADRDLLRHELVHVRQWRELGIVRFAWRYLGEYVAARRRGADHHTAYADISFEVEARALALA